MSQLDDIQRDVRGLNTKMDSVIRWQGAVEERCKLHHEKTENIQRTLYGNPERQDGLVSKVQCLIENKKRQITSRDFWFGVLQRVIVYVIIAALGFGFYIWKIH